MASLRTAQNVMRNAAKPGNLGVMAHKVWERARYGVSRERDEAVSWADAQAVGELDDWARGIDATLWDEAVLFARESAEQGAPHVEAAREAGIAMGGGGATDLLFFLTRLRRPDTVLETGVSHGWSTWAFLEAMRRNGRGRLLSSDFPYFRNENPEQWIAGVVPRDLIQDVPWELRIKGDRVNLEELLTPDVRVQLSHFDSDKSRAGRQFFIDRIGPHLSEDALVVMDDVGDNLWVRDHARGNPVTVFRFGGKHVAILGELQNLKST